MISSKISMVSFLLCGAGLFAPKKRRVKSSILRSFLRGRIISLLLILTINVDSTSSISSFCSLDDVIKFRISHLISLMMDSRDFVVCALYLDPIELVRLIVHSISCIRIFLSLMILSSFLLALAGDFSLVMGNRLLIYISRSSYVAMERMLAATIRFTCNGLGSRNCNIRLASDLQSLPMPV